MRILLSAFSCLPNRGSEPGIGWKWCNEVARIGHDVHVLTRTSNQSRIEAAFSDGSKPHNLHFHYCDIQRWPVFLEPEGKAIYLYNLLWQIHASGVAKALHQTLQFDLVHHITMGGIRTPSFMGRLNIPFWYGPLGGGETNPAALRKHYAAGGKVRAALRDMWNALVPFDPAMIYSFAKASRILVKTPQSARLVPARYRNKCEQRFEVGTDEVASSLRPVSKDEVRVLYLGRYFYMKGMVLGLSAFASALSRNPSLRLTMVGDGPEKQRWMDHASAIGLEGKVDWLGWVAKSEVDAIYRAHDIFLFPSMHDSSGNVILESAANGLPVLCLDLGGPGVLVDQRVGVKVGVDGQTEQDVVDALASALVDLASDTVRLDSLRGSALEWAAENSWHKQVAETYAWPGSR
jgi:glycosyltransferase involved in cell wall biosynthesis